LDFAETVKGSKKEKTRSCISRMERMTALQERITHALVKGIDAFIIEDVEAARQLAESPIEVIEGTFNDWNECGGRFVWKQEKCFCHR